MYAGIIDYIEVLNTELTNISDSRKEILIELTEHIRTKLMNTEQINLNFICTHNSRRSQMAQIWAHTFANYYNIPNIKCYSGGTETAAFYSNAVEPFRQIGFRVKTLKNGDSPVYIIKFSDDAEPIKAFSKVFDDPSNPGKDFVAVMNCSDADRNCPIIPNAEARFAITYNDPKQYDGSRNERVKYNESCRLIGREMMYVFSDVEK